MLLRGNEKGFDESNPYIRCGERALCPPDRIDFRGSKVQGCSLPVVGCCLTF
jgi:hypothetical protein